MLKKLIIIQKILKSPNFNDAVIIKLVEWGTATESERVAMMEEEFKAATLFVKKFKEGLENREDHVDQQTFFKWVLNNNIEPLNIVELQKLILEQGVDMFHYSNRTIRKWYGLIRPDVIFLTGRPPSQKP